MYQIGIDFAENMKDTISIIVDWSKVAKYGYSIEVNEIVPAVGKMIARLAIDLDLHGNQIIVFGHSLGVHVVGSAAMEFYNERHQKFNIAYGELQSHFSSLLLLVTNH